MTKDKFFKETMDEIESEQIEALKAREELQQSKRKLTDDIPEDPHSFYKNMGLLEHPRTREPVESLTGYQALMWKYAFRYKYRMIIKSQKVGITTSALMEDFQRAILPLDNPWSCRGREILIIAQKYEMAKEHLDTLYNMLVLSEKYRDFIIDKPLELTTSRARQKSKANMLYIYNPSNPGKPTRIIALGPRASGVWSWKNVKHIHMSDVAAVDQVDDSPMFGAAFSRLANTNGSMLIESPPRGQRGKVWDIYRMSTLKGDEVYEEAKFKVDKIPAREAVQAGLIDEEFLEQERVRLGVLYPMFYECEFLNPYTQWYTKDLFQYDNTPDYVEY